VSPMRHEDSKDEDSLEDAKTVIARTSSKDKSCFNGRKCIVKGHIGNHGTYKCIPSKEKEMCMIGIPLKDGDDTVEFDDRKVTQTAGDVTPRMEVENETVSPWSIHSPENKRLKIQEDKRQVEFIEKMDQYFDEQGLMLEKNKVKLNGIKPRMTSQEKTGRRGPTMEVQDLPLMPLNASLSSKESLHRLKMKRLPFEASVLKINELNGLDFERI
jgi:hypothetical protein